MIFVFFCFFLLVWFYFAIFWFCFGFLLVRSGLLTWSLEEGIVCGGTSTPRIGLPSSWFYIGKGRGEQRGTHLVFP